MRRPGRGTGATLAAALGVLVLAGAALLASHQPADPGRGTVRPLAPVTDGGRAAADVAAGPDSIPWWAVVVVLGLLLLVGGLFWVLLRDGLVLGDRGASAARQQWDGEEQGRFAGGLADETRAALADAAAGLDAGGDAREVVVACWVRIEAAADAAGLGRRPSETATDVARRWLAAHPDRAAVDELAALYHLARYSTHPLTSAHRARARAALRDALAGSTVLPGTAA